MQAASHSACTQTSVWFIPHASHTCCSSYKSEMKLSSQITRSRVWPQVMSSVHINSRGHRETVFAVYALFRRMTQHQCCSLLFILNRTAFQVKHITQNQRLPLLDDLWCTIVPWNVEAMARISVRKIFEMKVTENRYEPKQLKKTEETRRMQAVTLSTVMEHSCLEQLA